jgi:hypothetical protein
VVAAFGSNAGAFGSNLAVYGSNTAVSASVVAAFGSNAGAFGSNAGAFGSNAGAFGSNAGAFGSNLAVYGSNTAVSASVVAAFGSNAGAFGSNAGAFGSNAAAFGSNLAVYGSNTAVSASVVAAFGSNAGAFGSNMAVAASNKAFTASASGAVVTTDSTDAIVVSNSYSMSALANTGAGPGAAVSLCFAMPNVRSVGSVLLYSGMAEIILNTTMFAGPLTTTRATYTFANPYIAVLYVHNTLSSLRGCVALTGSAGGFIEGMQQGHQAVAVDNSSMYCAGQYLDTESPTIVCMSAFTTSTSTFTTSLKRGTAGAGCAYVFKASAYGDGVAWGVTLNGSASDSSTAVGVAVSGGNVYVCGTYIGTPTVHLNGVPTSTVLRAGAGTASMFVLKLDSGGTPTAVATITNSTNVNAYSIAADASGNVFFAGAGGGSTIAVYTGATLTTPAMSTATTDNFLLKCNAGLTPAWISNTGYMYTTSMTADEAGAVYVTGPARSPLTLYNTGNTLSTFTFPIIASGGFDNALVKYDANGTVQWVDQLSHPKNNSQPASISLSGDMVCVANNGIITNTGAPTLVTSPTNTHALAPSKSAYVFSVSKTTGALLHRFGATMSANTLIGGAAVYPVWSTQTNQYETNAFMYTYDETAVFDSSGIPRNPIVSNTSLTYALGLKRGLLTRYSLTTPVPPIYVMLPTPAPAAGNGAVKTLINASSSNAYVNVTTDANAQQIFGLRAYSSVTLPPYGSKQLTWYNDMWYA